MRSPPARRLRDSHICPWWLHIAGPPTVTPALSRGPSPVLAAASAVRPPLHRLRRHREPEMGPRLRGGDERGPGAGTGGGGTGTPRHVMKCHILSCAPPEMSCFVMVRRASGAVAAHPYPACRPPSRFVPLRSVPAAAGPAEAGPLSARIACARARLSAPARFARLIAPARARAHAQGALLLSVPLSVIFAPARGEAARGCRSLLLSSYHRFLRYKLLSGISSKNSEQTAFAYQRPAAKARPRPSRRDNG